LQVRRYREVRALGGDQGEYPALFGREQSRRLMSGVFFIESNRRRGKVYG